MLAFLEAVRRRLNRHLLWSEALGRSGLPLLVGAGCATWTHLWLLWPGLSLIGTALALLPVWRRRLTRAASADWLDQALGTQNLFSAALSCLERPHHPWSASILTQAQARCRAIGSARNLRLPQRRLRRRAVVALFCLALGGLGLSLPALQAGSPSRLTPEVRAALARSDPAQATPSPPGLRPSPGWRPWQNQGRAGGPTASLPPLVGAFDPAQLLWQPFSPAPVPPTPPPSLTPSPPPSPASGPAGSPRTKVPLTPQSGALPIEQRLHPSQTTGPAAPPLAFGRAQQWLRQASLPQPNFPAWGPPFARVPPALSYSLPDQPLAPALAPAAALSGRQATTAPERRLIPLDYRPLTEAYFSALAQEEQNETH